MESFQDIEHFVKTLSAAIKKKIPTKVSQLTNDAGYKTTDTNTTYKLSKSGSTVTLTGSDGSTTSVTDSNTTYSSLKNPYSLTIQNNGTTVASYDGSTAKTANFTNATTSANGLMSKSDKAKLDGIGAGSNVKSVNDKTGAVSLSKADVGLGNVDNTSDANKAVFESRLRWGGTNIAGDISPIDAAMSNIHSANRAAFADPAGIIVEFSNDGGSTWTDYGASNASKIKLVSGIGTAYFIGKHTTNNTVTVNDKLRITVNASTCGFYTALKKILINVSTNGAGGAYVELQKSYKSTETSWSSSERYSISGWSGWNSIPCNGAFGGGSNQTGNIANIRLTFGITSKGSSSSVNSLSVLDLQFLGTTYWGYHSEMAKSGHLYSYDAEQNASFPAQITAKQFNGTATNASKVNNHTVNSDVPSGAKFTDTTYGIATSSTDGLMSKSDKSKLDGIGAGSNVKSVNDKTGAVTLAKGDVGLGNVDNTADKDKSVKYAASADTVDGLHEYSFLRYRDATHTDGAETLWDQIGIREYDNALPSGLSGLYKYGAVVSLPSNNAKFDLYYNHQASANGDGLYYRTGWGTDKKGWVHLIDSQSIGSQSVNYANSAGSVAWDNVSGKPSTYPPSSHTHTPAQVGLGNVANLDQSKAIKSITRSGTTFTATALDGTKTTFTQQDNNTTYGIATSSADGLMSKSDKAKLDGIGTGSNVKSVNGKTGAVTLAKGDVGLGSVANYDQSKAIKSITRLGTTFTATALDGTKTTFTQQDSNTTYGIATSSANGLMSKADKAKLDGIGAESNVKSVNGKTGAVTLAKGDVGLGSVANYDQSKAIKSITRSGTTFTATALDGTTSTFTQQDITNNLNKEISDRTELISKDSSGNTVVTSTKGALYINTKNPIIYNTPQALNHYFKYIPATDRTGNEYKILVDNGAVFGSDFFSGIVIGCGDSIARGYPLSTNDGTLNKIAEKTGKTINTDFYNVAEDATGYTSLNGKITFRQQIEKLNNVITDKSNVTGIIVVGGTNDYGSDVATTDWANAVDDFITYAHSTYPNAKIAIVSNFMSNNNIGSAMKVGEYLHVLQTVKYPAYHVANLGVALKKWYLTKGDTMSDIIHPNAKGYDLAASFIITKIMGGVTEDYTFVQLSTRAHWDSCYIFNGDQFIFQFFSSDHFGNSEITAITHNNPGIMCNFNFTLKMRTVGLGGEVDQAWVTSQDCLGFVTFETSTEGWVNCFAPSLIKYELGNNGKIYAKIAGIDTKGSNGLIASNTIRELWCNPWLDGNLNHITLLV